MEINRCNYNPNFGAKIIIGNQDIEKYVKSSFMANSRSTFDTLDKFSAIYPDSVVSINIKNLKNRDYLVARNGVTGAIEAKLIHKSEFVNPKDRTVFIDLIKKVMNKKSFWDKTTEETAFFDATAIEPRVEHDVFKLGE